MSNRPLVLAILLAVGGFGWPSDASAQAERLLEVILADMSDKGELDARLAAVMQATPGNTPRYSSNVFGVSTEKPEVVTFKGPFTPKSDSIKLAIFSDDGCDVSIDGANVHSAFLAGQDLPNLNESFRVINFAFKGQQTYQITVKYSNILHPDRTDIDGATLFVYDSKVGQGGLEVRRRIDGQLEYKKVDPANLNANALAGEMMDLMVVDPMGGEVTDVFWAVPDVNFSDWTADDTVGMLTKLAARDTRSVKIKFYWVGTGQKSVVVNGRSAGLAKSGTATVTLDQVKNSILTGAQGGDTVLVYEKLRGDTEESLLTKFCVATNGKQTGNGIDFGAIVELPAGYAPGKAQYVQLCAGTLARSYNNDDNTISVFEKNTPGGLNVQKKDVLDTWYPYTPSSDTGPKAFWTDDSPSENLPGGVGLFKNEVSANFSMYLMFKPAGASSKYVPMRRLDWQRSATTTLVGGRWVIPNDLKSKGKSDSVVENLHPTWTVNWLTINSVKRK